MEAAKEIETDLSTRWNKENKNYPIRFIYTKDSTDFVVVLDMPKADYNNYIKYRTNSNVRKTWNLLVTRLKEISKDGSTEFLEKGFEIDYYFNVSSPNNRNEYIGIVRNGILEKNFMK